MDAQFYGFYGRSKYLRIYPEFKAFKVLFFHPATGLINVQEYTERETPAAEPIGIDLKELDLYMLLMEPILKPRAYFQPFNSRLPISDHRAEQEQKYKYMR